MERQVLLRALLTISRPSIRRARCAIRRSTDPISVRCSSGNARHDMGSQRNRGTDKFGFAAMLLCLFLGSSLWAQSTGQVSTPAPAAAPAPDTSSAPPEGKDIGGFHVTQSIDFGGRINDVSGSQAMYDTLVNLQSGARILEQSLTMQSLTHHDIFDTLTLISFGWGAAPEKLLRLRVSKYRWYTFSGSYQH